MDCRQVRSAFLLLFCLAPAALAQLPFQLAVQSGGSTFLVQNGSTLTLSVNAVGQSSSLTIMVTYQGQTSASVNQPQLFGQSSFSLGPTLSAPAALQPGQSVSFTVTYTAANANQAVGQLNIPFTEAGATPQAPSTIGTIGFTLNGTAPSLVVTYALPTNGNVVTVDTGNTISFPATVVESSIAATMGIVNRGSGNGTIQSISISGTGFSLQSLPLLPLSVASGSVVQFNVLYAPAQTGTNSGTLQIVFSDRTVTLGLQGTAIASLLTYQLLQGGQTTSITPGQPLTFPNTNVGANSSLSIFVQNTSSGPVTISGVAVTGNGFTITDQPILPVTLNVNDIASFAITFAPTQAGPATGKFRVGNDSFNLSGTAIGVQLVYSYSTGSTSNTVIPGGPVLFSPLAVGQTGTSTFTIQNTGTNTATITSLGISGTQSTPPTFTLASLPQLPLSLGPGQSTPFSVVFSPQTTGLATANLMVNDQQFTLSGFGNPPPALPGYQFTGASGTQAAMSQVTVGLSLAAAYSLPISGKLVIGTGNGSLPADPAVQFATGGQTVSFSILQGATQAVFPSGNSQISLQTGTVAGTITITPSFALASGLDITPTSPATVSLSVPTGPVYLLDALVAQEAQDSVTLNVYGYTTTRTLTTLQFQFTAQSSASLANGTVSMNIQPNAQTWFSSTQSQSFGGQFLVSIPFTLTSNQTTTSSSSTSTTAPPSLLSLLQSVSITASNEVGTSNAVVVSFTQ